MTCIRLRVDVVSFKRCFIWYRDQREFEDGLILFDNGEDMLAMYIEQHLYFNGTCLILIVLS